MNKVTFLFILILKNVCFAQYETDFSSLTKEITSSFSINQESIGINAYSQNINTNKNTGNLNYKIPLKIPKNALNINFINLTYNSSDFLNYGFGYGFNIDFPRIIKVNTKDSPTEFITYGQLGKNELIKTDSLNDCDFYKPLIEKSFHKFTKCNDKWFAYDNYGLTYTFSSNGLIEDISDLFENRISFKWDQIYIEKIDYFRGKHRVFEIEFKYNDKLYKIPKYIYNIRVTKNRELSEITINSKSTYKTKIENGYLNTIEYQNGKKIFSGSYKKYQHQPDTSIKLTKTDQLVFLEGIDKPEVRSSSPGDDLIVQYMDINADYISDKLITNLSEIKKRLTEILPKTSDDYKLGTNNTFEPKLDFTEASETIARFDIISELKFSKLNKYEKLPFKIFNIKLEKEIKKQQNISILQYTPVFETRKIQIIDLNNDGLKDIFYCPNSINEESSQLINYIRTNKLNKPKYNKAEIYYLKQVDEETYSWEKADTNIECFSGSELLDINLDGKIDIINLENVYLNTGLNFSKDEIDLRKIEIIENDKQTNNAKIFEHNGKIIIDAFDQITSLPLSGAKIIVNNDSSHVLEEETKVDLLAVINNDFGGEIQLEYTYTNGIWANTSYKHISSDLIESTNFQYISPRYDIKSGVFTGFTKIIEKYSDGINPEEKKVLHYGIDSIKNYYTENRLSLTGYPTLTISEQNKENYNKIDNEWSHISLDNNRIYPFIKKSTTTKVQNNQVYDQLTKQWDITLFSNFESIKKIKEKKYKSNLSSNIEIKTEEYKRTNLNLYKKANEEIVDQKGLQKEVTNLLYNQINRPSKICKNEICSELEYNNHGELVKITDMQSRKSSNACYDENGKMTKFANQSGLFHLEFDFITDRLLKKQIFKSNEIDCLGGVPENLESNKIKYSYFEDGLLKSISRNNFNLIEILSRSNNLIEYKYKNDILSIFLNDWGQITSTEFKNINEIKSRKLLTSRSRLLRKMENDEISEIYSYDSFGRLTNKTDYLSNLEKTYLYDEKDKTTLINQEIFRISSLDVENNTIADTQNLDRLKIERDAFGKIFKINNSDWEYSKFGTLKSFKLNEIPIIKIDTDFKNRKFKINDIVNILDEDSNIISAKHRDNFGSDFFPKNSTEHLLEYRFNKLDKYFLTSSTSNLGFIKDFYFYTYDIFGNLTNINSSNVNLSYNFDPYDRIIELSTTKDNNNVFKYTINYNALDKITSFPDFTSKIEYNDRQQLNKITYNPNLSMEINYVFNKIESICSNEICLKYKYNDQNKIISKKTQIAEKEKTYEYKYKNNLLELETEEFSTKHNRNDKHQVNMINDISIKWTDENLSSFLNYEFFYDVKGQLLKVLNNNEIILKKIDDNTYFLQNQNIIHRILLENKVIGIYIDDNFYPILSDISGNIIAMYSTSGELLWVREYDEWGHKSVIFTKNENAKSLEKLTIWSYSHLIEIPGLNDSKIELYWSKSRVYSPLIRKWLSIDPTYIFSPELLASKPNNWDYLQYASGDPINFLDPTGHVALPAIAMGAAIGGVFGAISGGIAAMATSSNLYNGIMVGMTTGAFIGSGASLVASLTGTGAILAQGSVGSIFGFTGSLIGQAGFTGKVDIAQSFVAGIGGGITTSFSAALGHSFNGFAKDLGVGLSYMSTDIGFSLGADRFSYDSFGNFGYSGFDSFLNSGDYDFGGNSSNASDYWSSNPYE